MHQSDNPFLEQTYHKYAHYMDCVRKHIINLYNKTRHSYIYMLPIAGQTARLNGLRFFVDTQVWPGVF